MRSSNGAWLSCQQRYQGQFPGSQRTVRAPDVSCCHKLHWVPTSGPHTQREILGAHSVLCGGCRLWAYSTLIWGVCTCCGQCRELGDASQGSEAVRIDWGDKGQ